MFASECRLLLAASGAFVLLMAGLAAVQPDRRVAHASLCPCQFDDFAPGCPSRAQGILL